ncbi:MAG: peptidoglycan DD-metalloendopeptidase family protein [Microcoleaceae cyanobacterium]
MKGTVPNSSWSATDNVTPTGSELGGSKQVAVSGNDNHKVRASAAMLGLAIVSGIFLPEGSQAAPEPPIESKSTAYSSDLSNGSESFGVETAELDRSSRDWQPSILHKLSNSNQEYDASSVVNPELEAVHLPSLSDSTSTEPLGLGSEGGRVNKSFSQPSDSGVELINSDTFDLDKQPGKAQGTLSDSRPNSLYQGLEAEAFLGSANSTEPAFSNVQQPYATSKVPGTVVIEPELTDTAVSVVYQVRSGETLAQIAASHDLSVEELTAANHLADPNLIEIDQKLKVPQPSAALTSEYKSEGAKFAEFTNFQGSSSSFQTEIALNQLAQMQKLDKEGLAEVAPVIPQQSLVANSKLQVYKPVTLAGLQDQPEQASVVNSSSATSLYTDRLRAEVTRLRAEYKAQKLEQLVPVAQTNGTNPQPQEGLNSAAEVAVQPVQRINPEFNPDAYTQQKIAAADKGHPPKSFYELAHSESAQSADTASTVVALAPKESVVATAPMGSGGYDPLKHPALGRIVSPDLPPMLGPDSYLPGSSTRFNGYIWPSKGILTSGYGWRWGRMHKGIDIAGPIGTPIVAAASGVVTHASWNDGGYGYLVEIEHSDGSLTLYAHNDRIIVNKGQKVVQGQHISDMGSTGRSTGPHLHFEVYPKDQGAVDPMALLPRGSTSVQAY